MRLPLLRFLLIGYAFSLQIGLTLLHRPACQGQEWKRVSHTQVPHQNHTNYKPNSSYAWQSIARGPSGYVATSGGYPYYSEDLKTWNGADFAFYKIEERGTEGHTYGRSERVAYLDDYFLIGEKRINVDHTYTVTQYDSYGMIWRSSDGKEWKESNVSIGQKTTILDIAHGNSEYVAIGRSGDNYGLLLYSKDGENWSLVNPGFSGRYRKLLYADGKYWITLNHNRTASLLLSNNGLNWTNMEIPNSLTHNQNGRVNWGLGLVIGKGLVVSVTGGTITTFDGNEWKVRMPTAGFRITDVVFRTDGFYAVGGSSPIQPGVILHSTDGKLWIPQGAGLNLPDLNAVVAYEDEVLAVGNEETILRRTSFSVPVIKTQPEGLSVSVGQDVEFAVDVEGPKGMTMQWIKDGVPVSGATESTLTLEGVSLEDAGEYWLEISSSTGVISTERAILSVNDVFIPPADEDAFVFRAISSGTPGAWIEVELNVAPEAGVSVYAIEDGPPSNWTVRNISDSGAFDTDSGRVKFGPFFDANARTLSYEVLVPIGFDPDSPEPFVGIASADGSKSPIGGDHFLSIGQTHPADLDGDFRLEIGEATGYGAAWKKSETWVRPPNPIPINYATHAGFLWKNGERYRHDASAGNPPLSWVSESVNSSAIGLASLSAGVAKRFRNDKEVKIQIFLPHNTSSYAVEEQLPFDVKVAALNEEGIWNSDSGVIRWGPFLDRKDRVLKYTIESSEPAGKVSGLLSVDGESLRILEGDSIGNEDSENDDNSRWKLQVDRFQGATLLSWSSSMDYEYRVLKRSAFIINENQHWLSVSEWIIGSENRMNYKIPSDSGLDHACFYVVERRPIMVSPDKSKRSAL